MKDKQKITPYLVLVILYIISIIPIQYLTILLIGKADNVLVILYGIFNSFFLMKYFKGSVFLSLLLGLLVSSVTLCVIYLLWFQGLFSKSFNPTFLFIILLLGFCTFLTKINSKIESIKYITLILLLPTLFILSYSLNLNDTYPTKTEKEKLTYAEIKIVDKQKMPKSGNEIEVRIYRQPLFGLRESHEIFKTITNENGSSKIQLSKTNNYSLTITDKENKLIFFDIYSADLVKKNIFVIEE